MIENREVKSDVFSMLMEEKEYALQVYNALNNSAITDPDLVEVVKLERGVSLTIRNDASFIVDMTMNIYEHQSTYNPNMPLRGLIYLSELLKDYVKENKLDLFSSKRIKIPTPKFVVFYNGLENRPEIEELKLSDSFLKETDTPSIEVTCTVYNINAGYNNSFLSNCRIINDYTVFIEKVREYKVADSEHPIEDAMNYCIENNILTEFLLNHHDEVLRSMTLDMTFEARESLIKRDAYEDGKEEGIGLGIKQGVSSERLKAIRTAIAGGITKDIIINVLKYTEDEYAEATKN